MKKILLTTFIALSFFAKGQIVNIPDTSFKNILLAQGVDANHDSLIQTSEAEAVTFLYLLVSFSPSHYLFPLNPINDLTGINAFINIKKLVYENWGGLTNLDLTGLRNLEFIDINLNPETMLGFELNITNVNLSGLTHLKYASIKPEHTFSHISNINVENCNNLKFLDCGYNGGLQNLNLSGVNNLDSLICWRTGLHNLDLHNCPNITFLDCRQTQMDSLDISMCPNLIALDCSENSLSYLNIKNGNVFPVLGGNDGPQILQQGNYWNYPYNVPFFVAKTNPNLHVVCTDNNETDIITNYFTNNTMPQVSVSPYCSFVPGGHFNTITGTVKLDMNKNGCDASDSLMRYLKIIIRKDTGTAYMNYLTNQNGNYFAYTNSGNYYVKPVLLNPYFTISPDSILVQFPFLNDSIHNSSFCISPDGLKTDNEINILPLIRPRPGLISMYSILLKNNGNQPSTGNIKFKFENLKLNFIRAYPNIQSQNNGELIWAYTDLKPFESRSINVFFTVLAPPTNTIGDSLFFTASITPTTTDETPADNVDSLKQVISGSYDPNDKTCLQGPIIDYAKKDEFVDYIIRFQNTGNDTAFNVVVKDILTDNYDWNSFDIVKTSHPCVINQTNGNKLEFIFEGINLPPKTINDSASNGFITFKIKPKSTIVLNDSLNNNAAIYFDYNLPVITNTATSVYKQKALPVKMEYFKGTTRNGNNYLTWKVNCTSTSATFNIERSANSRNFISPGNLSATHTRCLQPFDYIDCKPLSGINYYRIKMTDAEGLVNYSNTIALLNKKSGFEIINLMPTPVNTGSAILNISAAADEFLIINVVDISGKSLLAFKQKIISGFNEIKMNFNKLSAGTYIIVLTTASKEKKIIRFIKE